ncbi:protein-ADP-ribose hydrolase [Clostridium sp. AM58-1XD]|uniref:protein-ADP-ribose hydrolase n=1 Tax=Clostridium sp. AM58-1XD TaxID=2292307 RepID=UPI000E49B1FC|nr:protein-ADP-ribose hydrolase [Clostridium sp. AM58-1XD]RGY97965.1 protein-ADP-ribose hydrolase [Clostridium sp. AM58-1XD]
MKQDERRTYLIRTLLEEMPQYRGMGIPFDESGQKRLLRSLMNLRPPVPAAQDFLDIQDKYLSEEIRKKGITDSVSLRPVDDGGRIFLWRGDITTLKADAIVNAANSALLGCFQPCHSCIDNIIHTYSGIQLRMACSELMKAQGYEEPPGRAKITPGYNLPCRFVIHTVGPVVSGNLRKRDCELLAGCYQSCLELAVRNGISSIAFCCISTGVFCFPQDKAAEIAVETVSRFLERNMSITQVIFDVFTERDFDLYRKLLEG